MINRLRRGWACCVGLTLVLAACNMTTNPAPQASPTVGTPLAWATSAPNATDTPASTPPSAEADSASTIQPAPSVSVPTKAPLSTGT
ncbi:MAG TPA: hypothetical protein PKD09_24765, partial [Aggregatilinea sp.]